MPYLTALHDYVQELIVVSMLYIEIQRRGGVIERRPVTKSHREEFGVAEGMCPGCEIEPFLVRGVVAPEGIAARCSACNDPVGYVKSEPDTIFGEEEDRNMTTSARARVYGGEARK